jgi:hypothetical protein
MRSSTITTSSAASRRVLSSPANASEESIAWPPEPASSTVAPSILVILWMSLPMSGILFQPSDPTLKVTTVWAAWPSLEGMGPMTLPSTCSMPWSWAAWSFISTKSPAVNPDFFS